VPVAGRGPGAQRGSLRRRWADRLGPDHERLAVTELDAERARPVGEYRAVLPDGEPLAPGTQVIGRGPRLHVLTGNGWYQLDVGDIPQYPCARQAAEIARRLAGLRGLALAEAGRSPEVVRLTGQVDGADDVSVTKRQAGLAAFCVVANIAAETAHGEAAWNCAGE
jgi:hypothetical protein